MEQSEKIEEILCEMISAAGAARSGYISAIRAAKTGEENPAALMEQAGECYQKAHEYHHDLLTLEGGDGGGLPLSMFLMHVEDQLMCAETFRILAEEFIDLYKKLNEK